MDALTTITIEFFSDTEGHLKILEHRLKQIRDVGVELVEPRDATAPALVAIGIKHSGERAVQAAREVSQTLSNFLHDESSPAGRKQLLLFTIEGDHVDIETLSVQDIQNIILAAKAGEE
ncbi:MAG TPA: hypothetical protein VKV20_06150 [Ktedonobacteraceae bacterium]|nr:hypothetical protein [Ktedonobacteraceae bacterium]